MKLFLPMIEILAVILVALFAALMLFVVLEVASDYRAKRQERRKLR